MNLPVVACYLARRETSARPFAYAVQSWEEGDPDARVVVFEDEESAEPECALELPECDALGDPRWNPSPGPHFEHAALLALAVERVEREESIGASPWSVPVQPVLLLQALRVALRRIAPVDPLNPGHDEELSIVRLAFDRLAGFLGAPFSSPDAAAYCRACQVAVVDPPRRLRLPATPSGERCECGAFCGDRIHGLEPAGAAGEVEP